MARFPKMSVGTPVASIPTVSRKHTKSRLIVVRKALHKAAPGTIIPIYMGSATAANSLAVMLRKASKAGNAIKPAAVAVRKHIVYVQAPATEAQQAEAQAQVQVETPAPELTTAVSNPL